MLGVGAALLSAAAAAIVWRGGGESAHAPAALVVALAVLHSAMTTKAAPTMFRQKEILENEPALSRLFDRFARWQAYRCAFQLANFAALLWLWATAFDAAV